MKHFKIILQILKRNPKVFISGYFNDQPATIFPLFTGLLIRVVFQNYETNASDARIWWFIGLFISVLLGRIVAIYMHSITLAKSRFFSSSLVRANLLMKLMEKPGAEALKKSTGDTLNSFRDDVVQIEEFIQRCFSSFLSSTVFSIVSLYILMKINYKVTFFTFAPLIIVIIIVRMTGKRITKYRSDHRRSTGIVSSAIGEIFSNIQAIKVFGSEESIRSYFHKLNKDREKYAIKDNIFTQLLQSIYENILNIGTGLILIIVAINVRNDSFMLGDFTLFIYYLNFFTAFIENFGEIMTRFKHTLVAFKNITDISEEITSQSLATDTKLYLKEEPAPIKEMILKEEDRLKSLEIEGLTYRYTETKGGIEGISFDIKKNTFTVITGRVGSGKTTLLRTLLGLLKPQDGRVYWNSTEVDNRGDFFIPPRVAYSPQIPHFFSTTVKENLLLGTRKEESDIEDAIYLSVMEKDMEDLQKGLGTPIGTNGVKLSGGQQQRLSAARMLVRKAELFVFDDISSALDVETENILWSRLFERANSTCIAVSNRRAALKRADNIILLKDGKIEAQGKLEELLDNNEEMRLIWGEA